MRRNCAETAEFLYRFKAGESTAFEFLCKNYRVIAKHAIKGLCHENESDDIIQDVFLKVFKNREKYDPAKSKLTTWISRMAKSTAIDHYRVKKCRPSSSNIEDFDKLVGSTVGVDLDVSINLFRNINQEDMSIIRMKFVQDMRYEDIAAATNTPLGSVKSNIFRLKQKIWDNYENERASSELRASRRKSNLAVDQ